MSCRHVSTSNRKEFLCKWRPTYLMSTKNTPLIKKKKRLALSCLSAVTAFTQKNAAVRTTWYLFFKRCISSIRMKNYRIFVVPKQPVTDQSTDQAVNGQITVPSYLFGAFLACISTHSDGRNLPKHFM